MLRIHPQKPTVRAAPAPSGRLHILCTPSSVVSLATLGRAPAARGTRGLGAPRGATAIEYIAILGVIMTSILVAIGAYSPAMRAGAACMAGPIGRALTGGAECSGATSQKLVSNAGAMFNVAATRPPQGMSCDKMGCRGVAGSNCFAPGTLVSTESGARPIEQIVVGDRVWARDENSGETALKRVATLHRREGRPLARIEVASSLGSETLKVTAEHPFFVRGHGWTVAADLSPGDIVDGETEPSEIRSVASTAETSTVHNFEVEDFHTYFVGRAAALVHNDCAPTGAKVTPSTPKFDLRGQDWTPTLNVIKSLWTDMAQIDHSGVKPFEPNTTVHGYRAGWGWIRSDFYGVVVTMPPGVTPDQFLLEMQQDPHKVTGNDKDFHHWVTWDRPPPQIRKPGDIVDLQILGDPGGIMYLSTVDGTAGGPRTFTVVTVENEQSGTHPVNGYRTWGISTLPPKEGKEQQYVIWTAGIDSPSVMGSGGPGAKLQEWTWKAYINGVGREIKSRGGAVAPAIMHTTVTQPNDLSATNTGGLGAPSEMSASSYDTAPNALPRESDPRYSTTWSGIYHEAKAKEMVAARQMVNVQTLTDKKNNLSMDIREAGWRRHPITGKQQGYKRYDVRVRYDGELWTREEANVTMPGATEEWLRLETEDGKTWKHTTPLSPYYVELTPGATNSWDVSVSRSGWFTWVNSRGTSAARQAYLNEHSRTP